jgi:fucose permease
MSISQQSGMATRRALTGVVGLQLALFVTLGLPDGALGVAWPTMRTSVGRPLGDLGIVLATGAIGYLAGSTATAPLVHRFGTGRLMAVAAVGAAVALAAWTVVPGWPAVLAASGALGLSRGVTDAGLNAYAALHGGVRRLGLLHGCYGVGTSIGPLVVIAALAAGSWRWAWLALALADGAVAVWAVRQRREWPPDVFTVTPAAGESGGRPRTAAVAVTVILFAAVVGAEYSTGTWSYTLLTDARGLGDTAAGLWVAGYWGGLTIGRFALGAVGHHVRRVRLLNLAVAVALGAVVVLWADPFGAGAVALPLAGLGFAAVFPTLVALTPDRVGAHRSTRVISWSVAAGSVGGTAVAALAGALADAHGPAVLAPTLVVATAAVAALHVLLTALAPVR